MVIVSRRKVTREYEYIPFTVSLNTPGLSEDVLKLQKVTTSLSRPLSVLGVTRNCVLETVSGPPYLSFSIYTHTLSHLNLRCLETLLIYLPTHDPCEGPTTDILNTTVISCIPQFPLFLTSTSLPNKLSNVKPVKPVLFHLFNSPCVLFFRSIMNLYSGPFSSPDSYL